MKVLMVSREDVLSVPGGDTIQMLHTKNGLEKLGVQVNLGSLSSLSEIKDFDLIHVFNWELLEPVLVSSNYIYRKDPPIVLSPIFWFHTGHWFSAAIIRRPLWRLLEKTLGDARSLVIYEKWQQVKFRDGLQGRALRRSLDSVARLLPNSVIEAQHLETVLGIKGKLENRCTVVPNGVVRECYDPLPEPNRDFLREYELEGFILQVARIQSAKNQLGLIKSQADTATPIVFIGQPSPYETDYVDQCYEEGRRRGNVYFVGPKTSEELAGIYRLAAVHVLPSWRETPGLVSLEAAAAGCRIVTTSIGSAREYFGEDAWYCDPRDPISIRNSVKHAQLALPSEELRFRILTHYTWDISAKMTLNAYNNTMN